MTKPHLGILLIAIALLAVAPGAAQQVDVLDGKLVRADRTGGAVLPLPVPAVAAFAVAGDRVLVGAEPRQVQPGSDAWGGMNLWSVGLDGSGARRLVTGRKVLRAVWSERAGLAAVWTRAMDIQLLGLDGRVVRTIPRGASPAFSPDGTRLAYAALPATWKPGSLPGGFDLHVLDLATGQDRELTAGYDDAEPIWTPDGRQILFLSGRRTGLTSFWSVDLASGALRQVTNAGQIEVDERFVPNPAANLEARWSRDGSILLYTAQGTAAGEVMALVFDRTGKAIEARELGMGRNPAWSERGTVLVVRPGATGPLVEELAVEGETVRKVIRVSTDRTPEKSAWRPARGEEFLADGGAKTHRNPPLFRYPLPFHPAGPRYFYDHDTRAGWIASWKCDTETYDGHTGSDFPAPCGTTILAAHDGPVWARNDGCPNFGFFGNTCGGGYGNFVMINHGNNWYSISAHMQLGTPIGFVNVACGQPIGISASSGSSTGCHLHFEVQLAGFHGDPFAGACSGTISLWCSQHGDGFSYPGRLCC